jgi:hypothetical protein
VIDDGLHSAVLSIEFKNSLFASPGIIFKKTESVSTTVRTWCLPKHSFSSTVLLQGARCKMQVKESMFQRATPCSHIVVLLVAVSLCSRWELVGQLGSIGTLDMVIEELNLLLLGIVPHFSN